MAITSRLADAVGIVGAPPPQTPRLSADGTQYWDGDRWVYLNAALLPQVVAVKRPRNTVVVVALQQEYVAGDTTSFANLYQKTFTKVCRTLIPMFRDPVEAEDCAQDAFVRAFAHWASWRPTAPAEAWVMRIAKNGAISQIRKNQIRTLDAIIERLGAPEGSKNPWDVAEQNDFRRLIKQLSVKQTEVITYRFFFGYSGRETSRILRIPERTIASRLWSAKNALRIKLVEQQKLCAAA